MAQVVAKVTPQKLESPAWQQWIDGIDAFLLDCDGGAFVCVCVLALQGAMVSDDELTMCVMVCCCV